MNQEPSASKDRVFRCRCTRCSNIWDSDVPEPLQCPVCKSYIWDVEPELYHCTECGSVWRNKSPDLPRRCPQCSSESIASGDAPDGGNLESKIRDEYDSGTGCIRICMKFHASMTQVQSALRKFYPDESSFRM